MWGRTASAPPWRTAVTMQPTPYPQVNEVLDAILAGIRSELGDKLVGLYVFGSLVTDSFNLARSDLDLAVVVSSDLDEDEFARIERMHAELVKTYPVWNDRIEAGYISEQNVRDFDLSCRIAITSPGEPLHFRTANYGWLLHLDEIRKQGITLFGPPPGTMIEPIAQDDLVNAVRDGMRSWREWADEPDPYLTHAQQAYPIMTMCRALRTFRTGDFVSKNDAVAWAAEELPEWSNLIRKSITWRDQPDGDYGNPLESYPKTLAFVRYVTDLILGGDSTLTREQPSPGLRPPSP
jgi:predicted nucleotidyltransferase